MAQDPSTKQKAARADLGLLVQRGLLQDGDTLYLLDYQGNRVRGFRATISGRRLRYKGARYSMSGLATNLLKQVGYTSTTVRGPTHWATEKNTTISDLWESVRRGE